MTQINNFELKEYTFRKIQDNLVDPLLKLRKLYKELLPRNIKWSTLPRGVIRQTRDNSQKLKHEFNKQTDKYKKSHPKQETGT